MKFVKLTRPQSNVGDVYVNLDRVFTITRTGHTTRLSLAPNLSVEVVEEPEEILHGTTL